MILTLKSFSQDVDLQDPTKVQYFLVFDGEGKSLRLPVPKETTEELAKFLYSEEPEVKEYESPAITFETQLKTEGQEESEEAEEFGGDYKEEEDDEDEEEYTEGFPNSEEEVPSL